MLGFENVPRGKRLKYFKDYYLISTIVLVIIIIMVVSLIKATVFREKEDINILVAAASSDFGTEHIEILETKFLENFDIDFDGNGVEKLIINDAILIAKVENQGFETAEQDMVAGLKLTSVLETSLCTIQIVDEDMYRYLLGEGMIETYENLEEFGFSGTGHIKVPLSETKIDTKNIDPLYLTVRPKSTSKIKPEIYRKHINLVKQIIG